MNFFSLLSQWSIFIFIINITIMKSILIANRGEIASRIIRTCNKMGIKTIAIFSSIDKGAAYVADADEAYQIEGDQSKDTYLAMDKIIAIAIKAGADAIHPGYGFLSENEKFAKLCSDSNIVFIGPNARAIHAMGDKANAKKIMIEHHVPVVPGYQGQDQSIENFTAIAAGLGYPVLLKAAAGGGGKGMRIVQHESELQSCMINAKNEAQSSFGNSDLIIEKYFASARHIEIQIFGDHFGNVIHLFERECSIQRRYQKIMEESPSPVLSGETRKNMCQAAINAVKAIHYDNAGTVEFIYTPSGEYYFLEVNTRLQVEHPVTEMITGIDLVEWQINVAKGLPLPKAQEEITMNGYALEYRLYAEDATSNYSPATGTIELWQPAMIEGLRYETAIETGSVISAFYDPMIAKIIAYNKDRNSAMQLMNYALRKLICLGITTNQNLLIALCENEQIIAGNYDTHFLQHNDSLFNVLKPSAQSYAQDQSCIASSIYYMQSRARETNTHHLQKIMPKGWRISRYQPQEENYEINKNKIKVQYSSVNDNIDYKIGNNSYQVSEIAMTNDEIKYICDHKLHIWKYASGSTQLFLHHFEYGTINATRLARFAAPELVIPQGTYLASMPGQVVKVLANVGDDIMQGDPLIILSSMKMENTIAAMEDGIVEELYVTPGQNIDAHTLLLKIKAHQQ